MPRPRKFTETESIGIRMEKANVEQLDEIAAEKGLTRSKLVREILQRYLQRRKPRGS